MSRSISHTKENILCNCISISTFDTLINQAKKTHPATPNHNFKKTNTITTMAGPQENMYAGVPFAERYASLYENHQKSLLEKSAQCGRQLCAMNTLYGPRADRVRARFNRDESILINAYLTDRCSILADERDQAVSHAESVSASAAEKKNKFEQQISESQFDLSCAQSDALMFRRSRDHARRGLRQQKETVKWLCETLTKRERRSPT